MIQLVNPVTDKMHNLAQITVILVKKVDIYILLMTVVLSHVQIDITPTTKIINVNLVNRAIVSNVLVTNLLLV